VAERNWRWWFRVLHRDVGYLCVGLTLIYAVSGIAVNHVADWNPNYDTAKVQSNIGAVPHGAIDDDLARVVLKKLELSPEFRTIFQPGPHSCGSCARTTRSTSISTPARSRTRSSRRGRCCTRRTSCT
jgi:hypothetical protein